MDSAVAARVRSVYPGADMRYVESILSMNATGADDELALGTVLQYQNQSLSQFYETLLASVFLSHPLEPPGALIGDRFLSAPLVFSIANVQIRTILSTRRWWVYGNLSRYLSLDVESARYVARCRPLLKTHVLLEYISDTGGVLHVLPECIRSNPQGVFSKCVSRARLPFEYTLQHTLHHLHFNYSYSQHHKRLCSPVDQILYQSQYPIGRSMGTFYRAANGSVVLVSPSVRTVGYILSDSELEQIERIRCSLVNLPPGINPCEMLFSAIERLPNPDRRPSYILVPDPEMVYWKRLLGGDLVVARGENVIYLRPFSSLGTRPTLAHVIVVDNAHQLPIDVSGAVSEQSRHLICLSPCVVENISHLTRVCGLHLLSFQPLEAMRDLCIFPELLGPRPMIHLIEPEQAVSQAHGSMMRFPVSEPCQEYLLRLCAGGSVATMNTCTTTNGVVFTDEVCTSQAFGAPSDPCMVCLSTVVMDPVILPCLHTLCAQCMHAIAQISTSAPTCPSCRAPVDRPVKLPHWVERKQIDVQSKWVAVEKHVMDFLTRPSKGPLCIMTAYHSVAQSYLRLLQERKVSVCIYGFGSSPMLTDESVVICSFSSYDRYMHSQCVQILLSDIGTDVYALVNVLCSPNLQIVVCLMQGCLEETVFNRWCAIHV